VVHYSCFVGNRCCLTKICFDVHGCRTGAGYWFSNVLRKAKSIWMMGLLLCCGCSCDPPHPCMQMGRHDL
jgi:hypothetical protein